MAKKVIVSIVVAVTGDKRVYRLVESLLSQTFSKDDTEIIIIENGTHELSGIQSLDEDTIVYYHLVPANMAAARNAGLSVARGRYLLLTDADCVAQADWVEQMVELLGTGAYGAIGGTIGKFEAKTWTQRYSITIVDGQTSLNYLPALPLPYIAGANAGFILSTVRQVGGFDEAFHSGNDVDICYRIALAGYAIGLAPKAVILHEDRTGVLAHFCRFRKYAMFQVLLHSKYRSISNQYLVINPYPLKRMLHGLCNVPQAALNSCRGDHALASRTVLEMIEAAGIWCGDIEGSIRHKQIYI